MMQLTSGVNVFERVCAGKMRKFRATVVNFTIALSAELYDKRYFV